jgi:hypothetical protein
MINKQRLEKLIVALEGVKPKDFDMNNYVHTCGTPSCALGYFASRVDLQRKFVLAKNEQGYMTCQLRVQDHDYPVDYEDAQVLGYFGINREQAEYLFGGGYPNDGKTPAQMRRKIRKFIDKNGAM